MTDIDEDDSNAFHIYVPTPGDRTSVVSSTATDGPRGTVLSMGATITSTAHPSAPDTTSNAVVGTSSYPGFGVRTHGHIFLDGRGDEGAAADVTEKSRVTIQALGQAVLQSIQQSLILQAGRYMVAASNGDQYVSANGGLTLAAGWVGPGPHADPGPDIHTGSPTYPQPVLDPNYLGWMQGLGQVVSSIDGVMGSIFTYKQASDLKSDIQGNDPPTSAADWTDEALQGFSALQGAVSAAKSLHDSVMGGGVPGSDDANATALPSGSSAGPDAAAGFVTQGEGINLYGAGGIIAASPQSINMYAADAMSLGSTNNTLWGVDTEVFGVSSTVVNSASDLKLKAGGDMKAAAHSDIKLMAREGDVSVRGKRVQIGYARPPSEPAPSPSAALARAAAVATAITASLEVAEVGAAAASVATGSPSPAAAVWAAAVGGMGITALAATRSLLTDIARPMAAAPPNSAMQTRISAIDLASSVPDAVTGTPVIQTATESSKQMETEDILIKAKKRVAIKSHEDLAIGAAKEVKIRVGPMMMIVSATSATEGSISIGGPSGGNGSLFNITSDPFIKVNVASDGCTLTAQVADDVGIVLKSSDSTITFTAGQQEIKMDSSGIHLSGSGVVNVGSSSTGKFNL